LKRNLNSGWWISPDPAGSLIQSGDIMKQALLLTDTSSKQTRQLTLIIPRDIFSALHPMDKLGAEALEKVGAVIIAEDSDWV
jgi:hypothetical protein